MTWFTPRHRRDPRALMFDARQSRPAVQAPAVPLAAPVAEAPAPPAPPVPTYTPAPPRATGPMPVLPEPVPLDDPLPVFAAVTEAGYRVPSPYWCASCGTEYADEDATGVDRMLLAMHDAGRAAGWGRDRDGALRCPACRLPRNLPEVYGGMPAVVDMMIRALTATGVYEDLGRDQRRFDRAERQNREIALRAEWRGLLADASAATAGIAGRAAR